MDPITLMAAASAAFKGVQTLVEHGREVEDVFAQLSKWAAYTSDLKAWCQAEEAKPSIFKKLSFKDSTEEALSTMAIRMKIAQQEKDIREMFQWYGPPNAYEDFIKERRKIEAERKRLIHDQMLRRKAFVYNFTMSVLIGLCLGILAWMFITFYKLAGF